MAVLESDFLKAKLDAVEKSLRSKRAGGGRKGGSTIEELEQQIDELELQLSQALRNEERAAARKKK